MKEQIISKAAEIIKKRTRGDSYCALSLMDSEGFPTASTITASDTDGISTIYFGTGMNSNKAVRVRANNKACVCFSEGDYNISLVGTIEISTDSELKKEMWYSGLENHFTGYDDPDFCILIFKTKRYNLFIDWQDVNGYM